jgi:hypothetical protein
MEVRQSVEVLPLESLEEMRSGVDELVLHGEEGEEVLEVLALMADSPPTSPPVSPKPVPPARTSGVATLHAPTLTSSAGTAQASGATPPPRPKASYASPAGATKMAPTSVLIGQESVGSESRARRMTLAVDLNEYKAQLEQNDLQTKKTQQAIKGIRGLVSKKKKRFIDSKYDLDLAYITDRLIAMGFPSEGREGIIRNPMNKVQQFFEERHANHYKVYNLCSERTYKTVAFRAPVAHFGFDDHNPPTLELLDVICRDVTEWLEFDARNVAALHCLGADHEILTSEGFLGLAQLQARWQQVRIATLNPSSHALEYQRASRLVVNAGTADGELIEFAEPSSGLSLRVTPEHQMFVAVDGESRFEMRTAQQLWELGHRNGASVARVLLGAPAGRSAEGRVYGEWKNGEEAMPEWVWSLDSQSSRELLEQLPWQADGTLVVRSVQRRDDVARLATNAGMGVWSAACGDFWRVTLAPREVTVVLRDLRRLPNTEATFCVTVPNGTIFARRLSEEATSVPAVVGNCKAGKGRTGTVICAYLSCRYMHKGVTSQKALDFFAERRTHNKKGVTIASQIRWVHYYYKAKKEGIDFTQPKPLFLAKIVLHGAPNVDGKGGFDSHFVVSSKSRDLEYASKAKHPSVRIAGATEKFTFDVRCVVDKDVKLQFYKNDPKEKKEKLLRVFHVWFNTHFVETKSLVLTLDDVDGIKKTRKDFPPNFAVEFVFEDMPQ